MGLTRNDIMKYDLIHITKKGFRETLAWSVSNDAAEYLRSVYMELFGTSTSDYEIIESPSQPVVGE